MTPIRALAAAAAATLSLTLAACGSSAQPDRPAHRPISVIYIAGEPTGPWGARTEGLADGVKLAIAERNGIIGERAVSTVVVPVKQRDGEQVNAAIGAGRILRDSRALAVLGAYSALDLSLVAPQLNGGEIALLQYGSGMDGLTTPDESRREPGRFEPSGRSLAIRGVASDAAVADAIVRIPGTRGITVVAADSAAQRAAREGAQAAALRAQRAAESALADGVAPEKAPSREPGAIESVWTANDNDAARLAGAVRERLGGTIRPVTSATGPQVFITGPEQPDHIADIRAAARRSRGTLVVTDIADRTIPASAFAGRDGDVYRVRRTLTDASTPDARAIRARAREQFGRDGGEAVVAGYRAARRILELAAAQPERTIDRMTYATQLVEDAPQNADLPVRSGQSLLAGVVVERLRGGRWVAVSQAAR